MDTGRKAGTTGDSIPLAVEDYTVSPNERRLLIFTNSEKVWRENTRGDFWSLDLSTWQLRKLGGAQAKPSTLMFAKFSPDGNRVAYVRENNLYVENLDDQRITQLTHDGSRTVINGTFDWVYEEELNLRDGFRWSPDGARIAYWQLDASGVRDFLLINNTDSLYSFTIPVQYPKAGTTNSAARVGVVSASGGNTVWLRVPGDPRNNYIARLDWAGSSAEVVVQQLNRLQNTLVVMLGDAGTGQVRTVHTERDSAWVDVENDLRWLQGGKSFTWISERDGYRHLYLISRDGKHQRLLTPGSFDLHNPASRFWRTVGGGRGFSPWLDLLHCIARERHPAVPLSKPSRWKGPTGATDSQEPVRLSPIFHLQRWPVGNPQLLLLRHSPHHRPGHPSRAQGDPDPGGQSEAARCCSQAEPGPSGVREGGRRAGTATGCLGHETARLRLHPAVSGLLRGLRRAGGADRRSTCWTGAGYLWDLMLTQKGYVVASVDNRGTPAPRGRAFRKAIYQKVGVLNVGDHAAALRTMRSWPWVDSTRIGVWGWSGGGSMTFI